MDESIVDQILEGQSAGFLNRRALMITVPNRDTYRVHLLCTHELKPRNGCLQAQRCMPHRFSWRK